MLATAAYPHLSFPTYILLTLTALLFFIPNSSPIFDPKLKTALCLQKLG
jgi:hypothetical protein